MSPQVAADAFKALAREVERAARTAIYIFDVEDLEIEERVYVVAKQAVRSGRQANLSLFATSSITP